MHTDFEYVHKAETPNPASCTEQLLPQTTCLDHLGLMSIMTVHSEANFQQFYDYNISEKCNAISNNSYMLSSIGISKISINFVTIVLLSGVNLSHILPMRKNHSLIW